METTTDSRRDEPLDPWYVTGFVEGEGSFTFNRSGKRALPIFGLKLTAKDAELVERIQAYFGCGRLYQVKPRRPRQGAGWTKKAVYLKVTKTSELLALVRHFDRYPFAGAKKTSFAIWRRMVMLRAENYRNQPWDELEALAKELSASSPRNQAWSARERRVVYGAEDA